MRSKSVAIKDGISAPTLTNSSASADRSDVIAVLCKSGTFTVVDLNEYDYSNANPVVTSTTT
jgi:hypothetical protein